MTTDVGFDVELLDASGVAAVIAKPVTVAGEIVDIELVWMSEPLRNLPGVGDYVGARLSDVYPDLYDQGWLEELIVAKSTGKRSVRFRQAKVPGRQVFDVFEIAGKWAGEQLVLTVNDMTVHTASDAEVVRSVTMLAELYADIPIHIRLKLPNQTLEFSTDAFLELVGLDGVQLCDLVDDGEAVRLQEWLATPIESRESHLTFRSRFGGRWFDISAVRLAGTGIEYNVVRDVDEYVRAQRSSARLARELQGQLTVLGRALDASSDGFAIWRAVRDDEGEIETFTLDFMNTVGAAPTGRTPDELVNGRIDDIIGPEQTLDLTKLFRRCLESGQPETETVHVESVHGWSGAFENRVAPIGNDRVVASFHVVND